MKPINFNSEMIRALIAGRKTQTRRIVKPQSIIPEKNEFGRHPSWLKMQAPYGQPRDRLWVREKHRLWFPVQENGQPLDDWWHVRYAADDLERVLKEVGYDENSPDPEDCGVDLEPQAWRSSQTMPQWASRFTLEITNVRVERVQDISEEDAIAEGFYRHPETKQFELSGDHPMAPDARTAFFYLWESIYGKGACDRNDWVWVYDFKKL